MPLNTPICGCGRLMTCTNTAVKVLTHDENGLSYELWMGEEYACPDDQHTVMLVTADKPLAQHWHPSFEQQQRSARGKLRHAYYGQKPVPATSTETTNGEEAKEHAPATETA